MKLENVELLRFNTSKHGDEQNSFEEYVDRMKEGQNDICYITGESIATVSSSSFFENLRKQGYEVLYMVDPMDEYAVHQPKEFNGMKPKSTTKKGLDLRAQDEKKSLEELDVESKPLKKFMKETLGDKVEEAIVHDRSVDSLRAHTMPEHGLPANTKRIAQQPGGSQQQRQSTRQEREKERESVRKGQRGRGHEGRKNEEEREAEEGGGEQVEKDVTGWTEVTRKKRRKTVQIFVKVKGSKATPMEVSLTDDKVEDIVRQVQNDEGAYVTMQGKVLKTSQKLKSCGVTDGFAIQVTSRMRGGGKHKVKKSKVEKKQVTRREPVRNEGPAVLESEKEEADGLCAMVCEQMRWAMETMNTLQSTDEDKRRIAEEVEKVKKAMAGMEKQATGGDLQRVAEMEESFKKLEKKVQAKDVETGEKKVTREGRGCTGLVQGGMRRIK